MPVEFLTEAQERTYARFPDELTDLELAQFFFLDARDWRLLSSRRSDHNRLGFALHLCTVRFLGAFLPDLEAVPMRVLSYMGNQLGIADPRGRLDQYQRGEMRLDHQADIRASGDYRSFSDGKALFPLLRILYARAWLRPEPPSQLFDVAVRWLLKEKILLPGISVLARLVARLRDRVAERVWSAVGRALTPEHRSRLDALLNVPTGASSSQLDRLRRGPTRTSSPALVQALTRLEEVRALGMGQLDTSAIPVNRLKVLATYAVTSRAQTLARMPDDRRAATLAAFAQQLEKTACDDALDLLDILIATLLKEAGRAQRQERLRTLRDLDAAALTLADIDATLLIHLTTWTGEELRAHLDHQRDRMGAAIAQITALARPPGETYQRELRAKYRTVRHFFPHLLRTIDFDSAHAGKALTDALAFLKSLETRSPTAVTAALHEAPLEAIPAAWRRLVAPPGKPVDRAFYTLCVLEQLQTQLRRREVFVTASGRWTDPRAKLLQGAAWETARAQVCAALKRDPTPDLEVASWARDLDVAYRRVATNLLTKSNTAVRLVPVGLPVDVPLDSPVPSRARASARTSAKTTAETTAKTSADGQGQPPVPQQAQGRRQERERLTLEPLADLPEPLTLQRVRVWVQRRLPTIDLPELLLEMFARTGCATVFTHVSERQARIEDFPLTLCAALVAQACNLPVAAVAQPDIPALTADRIVWVTQNYLRVETIGRANARLVAYARQIALSAVWGGGEVASADGLRFVVPVRTINAGPNGKYFGVGRGVTLIDFTYNSFFGFNGAVVAGTLRDSLYVLEGLLNQDPALRPQELMTDTASYSDIVFGLFALLGYQFSPRLADIGETRFWRMDPTADYGPLQYLSRHRIDRARIAEHWETCCESRGR